MGLRNSRKPILTLAEAIHRATVNSAVAGIPASVSYLQKLRLCAPSPERADSIALVLSEDLFRRIQAKNRTSSPETT